MKKLIVGLALVFVAGTAALGIGIVKDAGYSNDTAGVESGVSGIIRSADGTITYLQDGTPTPCKAIGAVSGAIIAPDGTITPLGVKTICP